MAIELQDRLKKVRESLGLSQKELASKLGDIPVSAISKYERGEVKPSFDMIAKYGSLGIDANWLLTGEGPMCLDQQGQPSPSDCTDDETREAAEVVQRDILARKIAVMLGKMDEQERRNILELAERLEQASKERREVKELKQQVRELMEKVAG